VKKISYEREIDAAGIRRVEIDNRMSMLIINQGNPEHVIINACLSTREDIPEEMLKDMIHCQVDGDEIKIELDEYCEHCNTPFHCREFECRITLPANLRVKVENENEKLVVEGLSAMMDLVNENGKIMVRDCSGAFDITNENGAVRLENCHGDLKIEQENGPVAGVNLKGDRCQIDTENGLVKIREARYPEVAIKSENGGVFYETLAFEEGKIRIGSENGVVVLSLPENMEIDLAVETELGMIRSAFDLSRDEEGVHHFVQGEGKVKVMLETENGPVKIIRSGQNINLDALKAKLDHLKDSIANSKTLEDREQSVKIRNSIIDYLNTIIKSAQDKAVEEKINAAIGKLRKALDEIDLDEAKDKVVDNIEQIGKDVFAFVRETAGRFKDRIEKEHKGSGFGGHIHRHIHKIFDKDQFRQMLEPLRKMKSFRFDLNDEEHEQVSERSRMKILEMLEAGKITAEEAERLLQAIGRE